MRRSVLGLLALLMACLGTFGAPGVARAECPFFPVPPATDAAPSAREVFVGRVVENVGGQLHDFRLEIDHVLRGPARVGDIRRFDFVFPGWPLEQTPDGKAFPPCEAIPGWQGNVIAFSLGALAPDGQTRYNAASWISGDLVVVHRDDLPRTTLEEMVRLAALPSTDTAVEARTPTGGPWPIVLVVAIAGAIGALRLRRDAPRFW